MIKRREGGGARLQSCRKQSVWASSTLYSLFREVSDFAARLYRIGGIVMDIISSIFFISTSAMLVSVLKLVCSL
jgi:hypothetical protein